MYLRARTLLDLLPALASLSWHIISYIQLWDDLGRGPLAPSILCPLCKYPGTGAQELPAASLAAAMSSRAVEDFLPSEALALHKCVIVMPATQIGAECVIYFVNHVFASQFSASLLFKMSVGLFVFLLNELIVVSVTLNIFKPSFPLKIGRHHDKEHNTIVSRKCN